MKNEKYEKAFESLIRHSLDTTERCRGEHVYFEINPSDPNAIHYMKNNEVGMENRSWAGEVVFTKEILEKIVRTFTPTSKAWSITNKIIFCTTLPCPCCSIAMFLRINCCGSLNQKEMDSVEDIEGLYRIHVRTCENDLILEVDVYKLNSELISENQVAIDK